MRPALAGLVLLSLTAACSDDGENPAVTSPGTESAMELARLECTVTVADGRMACRGMDPSTGEASGLFVGGPNGTYVDLTASNHVFDPVDSIYSIDVTVQNLLSQALGTTDGTTLDPMGVRVFFDVEPFPTAGDMGAALELQGSVQRAFIARANQAYYEYAEVLQPNATSSVVTWEIMKPPAVSAFRFNVYVQAAVPYPMGRVEITPAPDTVLEGGTTALTHVIRNAYGNAIPDQSVTWGTSDAGIATVDGSGVVTGVAPGQATITATQGARTGSATIVVCPDLAVGEVYTAVMPDASELCLGGGTSGNAEYTYMPVNLSSSSALSLTVTGTGIVAVTGPPSPALLPGGTSSPLASVSAERLEAMEGLHLDRLERDRRDVAGLMGRSDARINRSRRAPGGPRMVITPGVPTVGDLWNLNVAAGCSGALDTRVGRVRSIGQHVVIVSDTANPAGGFTTAQYDSIALEFDTIAYPVDTANFGGPTDMDNNGRVVLFFTRAVNELSPPASSVVELGYFTSRDLFSSAPAQCERSNEGEILYMLVPDPTGAVNSNVRTVSFVRGNVIPRAGHELQHLINASRRIYIHGASSLEETWLNEGLSSVAEELMFYRTSVGLAPRGNIVVTNLTTGPNASRRVAAFNTYANPNFGRLRSWLQRPDTAGAFKSNDGLAVRGVTWAFLRYAADRVNGSDAAFWSSLVNTTATGTANLQAVLGADPNEWLRDFTSAMYADDAVTGIGPAQQVTSWNFRSLFVALNGSYQLVPRPLTNGVGLTLSYSRSGGTAYARFGVPTGGFAAITALSGGVPPTSPYALIVIRTK